MLHGISEEMGHTDNLEQYSREALPIIKKLMDLIILKSMHQF